jgi:superfamily II RNA helicase
MGKAEAAPLAPMEGATTEAILERFLDVMAERGLELYAEQEEAILELYEGHHVILKTPTGSGKSLVAGAMIFEAVSRGERAVYTCPIKALVNEKFLSLCREHGADNVGLMTGDATVNGEAPIICCTAEILSNLALRGGERAEIASVVMDEFHYYGDG